jgi:hypothetical protein
MSIESSSGDDAEAQLSIKMVDISVQKTKDDDKKSFSLRNLLLGSIDGLTESPLQQMRMLSAVNKMVSRVRQGNMPHPAIALSENHLSDRMMDIVHHQDHDNQRFTVTSYAGNRHEPLVGDFGNEIGACKIIRFGSVTIMHDFGLKMTGDGSPITAGIPGVRAFKKDIDLITVTHGHEDHKGAFAYESMKGVPVICTPQDAMDIESSIKRVRSGKQAKSYMPAFEPIKENGYKVVSHDGGQSGIAVLYAPNLPMHSTYVTAYYYAAFYTDKSGRKRIRGVYSNMGDIRMEDGLDLSFFRYKWKRLLKRAIPDLNDVDIPDQVTHMDIDTTSARQSDETPRYKEVYENFHGLTHALFGLPIISAHIASGKVQMDINLTSASRHKRDFITVGANIEKTQSINNIFGYSNPALNEIRSRFIADQKAFTEKQQKAFEELSKRFEDLNSEQFESMIKKASGFAESWLLDFGEESDDFEGFAEGEDWFDTFFNAEDKEQREDQFEFMLRFIDLSERYKRAKDHLESLKNPLSKHYREFVAIAAEYKVVLLHFYKQYSEEFHDDKTKEDVAKFVDDYMHFYDALMDSKHLETSVSKQILQNYRHGDAKGHQNQIHMDTVFEHDLKDELDRSREVAAITREDKEAFYDYIDDKFGYLYADDQVRDFDGLTLEEQCYVLWCNETRHHHRNIGDGGMWLKGQYELADSATLKKKRALMAREFLKREYFKEQGYEDKTKTADTQFRLAIHTFLSEFSNNFYRYKNRRTWAQAFDFDHPCDLGSIVVTRNTLTSFEMFKDHPERMCAMITGTSDSEIERESTRAKYLEGRSVLNTNATFRHTARPLPADMTAVTLDTQSAIPGNEAATERMIKRHVDQRKPLIKASNDGFDVYCYKSLPKETQQNLISFLYERGIVPEFRHNGDTMIVNNLPIGYRGHGRLDDLLEITKTVNPERVAAQHCPSPRHDLALQNGVASIGYTPMPMVEDFDIMEIDRFARTIKSKVIGRVPGTIGLVTVEQKYQKPYGGTPKVKYVTVVEPEKSSSSLEPLFAGCEGRVEIRAEFNLPTDFNEWFHRNPDQIRPGGFEPANADQQINLSRFPRPRQRLIQKYIPGKRPKPKGLNAA